MKIYDRRRKRKNHHSIKNNFFFLIRKMLPSHGQHVLVSILLIKNPNGKCRNALWFELEVAEEEQSRK